MTFFEREQFQRNKMAKLMLHKTITLQGWITHCLWEITSALTVFRAKRHQMTSSLAHVSVKKRQEINQIRPISLTFRVISSKKANILILIICVSAAFAVVVNFGLKLDCMIYYLFIESS